MLSLCLSLFAKAPGKSAIVYYGNDISYANVGIHDYIIVEADNISPYTHGFKTYKEKIYAYVSVGEASSYRPYFKDLEKEWKIAENSAWKSTVLDVSNDEYHTFMFEKVIQPLVEKGHENFFFDTLDSYELAVKDEADREEYKRGLIRFIKKFKVRFPNAKLIINRGFEIIDSVHKDVDAVLFESLFNGLSSNLTYTKVSKEDRQWLLSKVDKVKSYGLDIIAVEYIDITAKEEMQESVKKIQTLGIIPYIANKELTRYGDSSKVAYKREILVLYNTAIEKELSSAHFLASLPLEYLGYIPVLKRIQDGLPDIDELSRYKAVIVWPENVIVDTQAYEAWIKLLLKQKIKVLFLQGFGPRDDTALSTMLGVEKVENRADVLQKQEVIYKDSVFDFETPLRLNYTQTLYQPKDAQALLRVANQYGQTHVPVAISVWGGYALSGMLTASFADDTLWIINPFEFFKMALDLEDIPVPDPTTQNGRRLLFAHIDGDAAMNKVEWNPRAFSIGMMYERILSKYTIPQSVSIVQAETDPNGIYPQDSQALEEEAKKIFRLDHVEGATHTLTHPFAWGEIHDGDLKEEFRLKLNDYNFSIDKEIQGSLEYINTRLMPEGKRKANTIFWTGDCMPQEDVLEYTYKNGILNINGGYTTITNDKPWLSLVASYGLKRGEYRQVYTGAENENVYTNDWHGPFWGFKKVIQTFKLTDTPRRLKPIDIYYHFYAASKTASLSALDDVYRWALQEETMPIYTSQYIPKVLEFYDISMSRDKNVWHFEGMKELKTLRLDKSLPKPEYKDSQVIIGQKDKGTQVYLHLNTQAPSIDLKLDASSSRDGNYLIDTNAEVLDYNKSPDHISFRLESYVALVLNYHLQKGCTLESTPKAAVTDLKENRVSMKFKGKEADVVIKCR